jgi:hypothetical protein
MCLFHGFGVLHYPDGGTYSAGQVYVALSRARRLDGLQIIGLTASSVRSDATVSLFYEYKKKGLPYTPTLWMDSA